MTTIENALSKYKTTKSGIAGVLDQSHLDYLLEKDFETLAVSFISIAYLLYVIREVYKSKVSYYSVIDFFKNYGIETLHDFYQWNDALKKANVSKIVYDVQPKYYKLNYDNYEEIKSNDLMKEIWNKLPKIYTYDWVYNKRFFLEDSVYKIITLNDLKEFLKVSLVNNLSYRTEKRDCDDFAKLLKCEFRKHGYGNVSVAFITVNLFLKIRDNYTDPNLSFEGLFNAHALNMAYVKHNDEYKLVLIEPQTDRIFDFGDPVINTKYYKIRKIEI